MQNEKLQKVLQLVRPASIIAIIEQGIAMEQLVLEAAQRTRSEFECDLIRNRIADAKIFRLILTGDIKL